MNRSVFIDTRMRDASGIGTYIRGLTGALHEAAKDWSIHTHYSSTPIYSLREQLELPRAFAASRASLFHAPHYNLPAAIVSRCVVTVHDLIHIKFPQFLPSRLAWTYAQVFFRFLIPPNASKFAA